jgi:hypothetical protein
MNEDFRGRFRAGGPVGAGLCGLVDELSAHSDDGGTTAASAATADDAANPRSFALSVDEFCQRYRICRSTFYKSLREGWGPEFIQIGRRKRITPKQATAWERRMEKMAARGRG